MRPWFGLVVVVVLLLAIAPFASAQTFQLSSVCATSTVNPCNTTLTAGGYAYLNGTGFGSSQGSNYVDLQNSRATVDNWSSTQIQVTVPYGTVPGTAYVNVSNTWSDGVTFGITPPTLTSICPTSSPCGPDAILAEGQHAYLNGSGFNPSQGTGYVDLANSSRVPVVNWASGQIEITVPYGTYPGNATVSQNGTWSQAVQYTFPTPNLASVSSSPTSNVPLMPGGIAYLTGSGFGAQQYTGSGVYLQNSSNVPILKWTDTQIIARVPVGTITGNAYVQNSDQPSGYASFQMANPQVFAFGAPFCWANIPGCNTGWISDFISNELPSISGIVIQVPWSQLDDGSCTDSSGVARCTTEPLNCTSQRRNTDFNFCALDEGIINNYVSNSAFAGKRIVFLIQPASDSGTNSFTPAYVITPGWATELTNTLHKTIQPQDQVVCGAYLGNVGSNTCPVENSSGQQIGLTDISNFAVWNANYCTTTFRNTRAVDLTCNTNSSCTNTRPYTNNTGFPIPYETPFMTAYQGLLKIFAQHYNPVTGNALGQQIAPYIAYVRPGMTVGSETTQLCAIQNGNGLTQNQWAAGASIPAGYIVNTGTTGANGTQYVAIGAGITGSSMPTC